MKNRYLMLESSKKNKNKLKSKLLEDKKIERPSSPVSTKAERLMTLTNGK